jgi:hypothetical protein
MSERAEPAGGFSVLDGAALVVGAAVAAVHLRGVIPDDLTGPGWVLVWGTFTWVALTAAGPIIFLVRRFARKRPEYPKVGDTLWLLLGLPWIATALVRSDAPEGTGLPRHTELYTTGLSVGLAVVALIALAVVWTRWVSVTPEQAGQTAASPWTNRVGLILAVAWPVQCGLGLVVTS